MTDTEQWIFALIAAPVSLIGGLYLAAAWEWFAIRRHRRRCAVCAGRQDGSA